MVVKITKWAQWIQHLKLGLKRILKRAWRQDQASLPAQHSSSSQTSGFSLIEILVAAFVVGVALTAIATVLTYTINLSDQGVQREAAVQLAQEGIDFFKRERVILGWNDFVNELSSSTYCLEQIPDPSLSAASSAFDALVSDGQDGACQDVDGNIVYAISQDGVPQDMLREANVTEASGVVTIQVEVRWPKDATQDYQVQLEQELRQY